jgi:DNA-binding PadR family transcriptional regulator
MSKLRKGGMVERRGVGKRTGIYCITEKGVRYLEEIEP